jgi:hypothetical protein
VEVQRFALPKPKALEPEFAKPKPFTLRPSKMGPISGPSTAAAATAAAPDTAGPSSGTNSGGSPGLLRKIAQNFHEGAASRTRSKVQIQGDPTKIYLSTRRKGSRDQTTSDSSTGD